MVNDSFEKQLIKAGFVDSTKVEFNKTLELCHTILNMVQRISPFFDEYSSYQNLLEEYKRLEEITGQQNKNMDEQVKLAKELSEKLKKYYKNMFNEEYEKESAEKLLRAYFSDKRYLKK